MQKKSIIGKKFDKLTVIEVAYIKNSYKYMRCVCECGKEVVRRRDAITRKGGVKSCGCFMSSKATELWERRKQREKEREKRRGKVIESDELFDISSKEGIELIMKKKKVSKVEACFIYKDWRERYKKDNEAFIWLNNH